MPDPQIAVLLRLLDEAYDHKSWHGTNLRGSVRGLTPDQARWRPGAGRHNIWEIAVHCAYWKYVVRRRLLGEPKGSFVLKGSNWFPREGGEDQASSWRADLTLLADTHRRLREAVAGLPAGRLHTTDPGSEVSTLSLVTGIAAHDLYHAGQIQLLKRLQSKGREAR